MDRATTRGLCTAPLVVLVITACMFGQGIKTEVVGAFIWGEDSPSGAISSTAQDPLTGQVLHKLRYGSIEVSSRIGFERVNPDEVGTYLSYTATIINGSDSSVSVRYGGISVDGHAVPVPKLILPGKKLNKAERMNKGNAIEPAKMQCFATGFLSYDHLFSADGPSQILNVSAKTALTVSSIVRDPRSYPLRCSVEGCHPIGTIRYYLTVDSQDYVFVWPGRSAIYCGK